MTLRFWGHDEPNDKPTATYVLIYHQARSRFTMFERTTSEVRIAESQLQVVIDSLARATRVLTWAELAATAAACFSLRPQAPSTRHCPANWLPNQEAQWILHINPARPLLWLMPSQP